MCGINTIISLNTNKETIIKKMNFNLSHRGYDNDGVFIDEKVAFGHRRLSIIDLSQDSNQPMYSNDKNIVLIFNGEIYNYKELRKKLDYPFRTKSDSEIIIALYYQYGNNLVPFLDGMFSFAIYDKNKNTIFIARDRLGIKPLYYYLGDNFLVLSSEIRPILKSKLFNAKIDSKSFTEFVQYKTIYNPNTIVEGLKMMPPGTIAELKIKSLIEGQLTNINFTSYWSLKNSLTNKETNQEKIYRDIKDLFVLSVEKRLVSDVPIGAFLSGGIDSTAIVGAMSSLMDRKVDTFNIDFAEEKYSESKYARIVSKRFNTNHHEIKLTPQYFLENLEEALAAMDHPSEDGLNTYFVSKVTKEHGLSVALSGLGGDELFGGYYVFDLFNKMNNLKWLWSAPQFLKKKFIDYRKYSKPGMVTDILASTFKERKYSHKYIYQSFRKTFSDEELYKLTANKYSYRPSDIVEFDNKHLISTMSSYEISTYMQNVLLQDVDKMSMASTLEVRVPFLDYRLVEYVISIPDKQKGLNKKLLLNSLKEFLPDEVINRPKMGFVLPISDWLKSDLNKWADEKIQSLRARKGINSKILNQLWLKFNNTKKTNTFDQIWHLVVLEYWLQKNID